MYGTVVRLVVDVAWTVTFVSVMATILLVSPAKTSESPGVLPLTLGFQDRNLERLFFRARLHSGCLYSTTTFPLFSPISATNPVGSPLASCLSEQRPGPFLPPW